MNTRRIRRTGPLAGLVVAVLVCGFFAGRGDRRSEALSARGSPVPAGDHHLAGTLDAPLATADDRRGVPDETFAGARQGPRSPSLYERLGGLAPIKLAVSDFIDTLAPEAILDADPAFAVDAAGQHAQQQISRQQAKYHITAMLCQAAGGPCVYDGRATMRFRAQLEALNLTDAEWNDMVALFQQMLARHNIPAPEILELLDVVGSARGDILARGVQETHDGQSG